MHCVTLSFVVFVWAVFTKLCGASLQHALDDPLASASESVRGALIEAAIIPDGNHLPDWSIAVALPL